MEVPAVYTHNKPLPTLSVVQRMTAFVLAGLSLALLLTASRLTPDSSGMGTHHQLGLPRCGWLVSYGLPCPTCGMTTSFAHVVRGELASSLYAQPMGTLIALAAAMTLVAGLYCGVTGLPGAWWFKRVPTITILFAVLALTLVGWAWKIAIVVLRSTSWPRIQKVIIDIIHAVDASQPGDYVEVAV